MSGIFFSGERDVRTKLNEALQRYGIKQVDIARETGIHLINLSIVIWVFYKQPKQIFFHCSKTQKYFLSIFSNRIKIKNHLLLFFF